MSAIGLFHDMASLPTDRTETSRNWRFGNIAPFAGRIAFERLDCSGIPSIRITADDAVQSLEFCHPVRDDICPLKAFLDSQTFARRNGSGRWAQCGWKPSTGFIPGETDISHGMDEQP